MGQLTQFYFWKLKFDQDFLHTLYIIIFPRLREMWESVGILLEVRCNALGEIDSLLVSLRNSVNWPTLGPSLLVNLVNLTGECLAIWGMFTSNFRNHFRISALML